MNDFNQDSLDAKLIDAIERGDEVAACGALKQGASVFALNPNTNTKNNTHKDQAIDMAASRDDCEGIIKHLLAHGASANARNGMDSSPLSIAAFSGQVDNMLVLLDAGADINYKNKIGHTVFMMACASESDAAKLLHERGADVFAKDRKSRTAINTAIEFMKSDNLQFLIELGLDVNNKNDNHHTPLMSAVRYGKMSLVIPLLDGGADMHIQDHEGVDSVMVAAMNDRGPVLAELLNRGANIKALDKKANTVLDLAAEHDCTESIAVLLEMRGDEITDEELKDAAKIARRYTNPASAAIINNTLLNRAAAATLKNTDNVNDNLPARSNHRKRI